MSFSLCSSQAIIRKAGSNVNTTIAASGAAISNWCDQAEGYIINATRRDWVDQIASVDSDIVKALNDCCSSLAAMKLIEYDMSGYFSRLEAQTMLDVLRDNATQIIKDLQDFKSNEVKSV